MRRITGLLVGLLLSVSALAASGNLSFTRPTSRADGSPLAASEIASYQISCSYTPTGGVAAACSGLSPSSLAGSATGGTVTFNANANGRACFSLVTVDTAGRRSAPSAQACKDIAIAVPNPPGNVTVAVVIGLNMAPVFKLTSTGKRSPEAAGFIAVNEPCSGNVLFYYRNNGYRRVDSSGVLWWGGIVPSTSVAAPCASAT